MGPRLAIAILLPLLSSAEPKVMLLVDTSSSMLWPACGGTTIVDGTAECPGQDVPCDECAADGCGDGVANDSRLSMMKGAIDQLMSTCRGTRFGLARFHQQPTPFECPGGGWSGTAVACAETSGAEPGEGFNRADILVPIAAGSADAVGAWTDHRGAPSGVPDHEGCDLCGDCGGGCDEELRASGGTPVAGSLRTVRDYFEARIMPEEGGPYGVYLFTDGIDNCPGDAVAEAEALCEMGVGVQAVGFQGDCPLACGDPCFSDCEGGTCPRDCASSLGLPNRDCVRDCSPACLAACELHAIATAGCGSRCRNSGCDPQPIRVEDGAELAAALEDVCRAAGASEQGCGCRVGGGARPSAWPGILLMALVGIRGASGGTPAPPRSTSRAC